jgi:polyvinyl alcohol dehydrogenase (cytochrome)
MARLLALVATLFCASAQAVRWPTYGFDLTRSRFNPAERRIGPNSVGRLAVRWFFQTAAPVSASPSVVGGTVYVGSWNGNMYALAAATGQPRWTFDIADRHPEDRSGFPGIQSSAAVSHGKVYFGAADANVYALAARNGTVSWKVSLGNPDTAVEGAHVWSSPAVFDGTVFVGKASHIDAPCVRGAVFALDARTGTQKWRFDVLPNHVCANDMRQPCEADADCPSSRCAPLLVCRTGTGSQLQSQLCASDADCTAPATCQQPLGGGVVSSPSIDRQRRVVYVATGDCVASGATGLANSIIALDADSGALRWAFHPLPPADLRDFDFIASPNIFTSKAGGTTRHLIGAGSKDGIYYAVDQDTGALAWQAAATPGIPNLFGGFNASTGSAFGDIYAATFSGPPFTLAIHAFDGSPAWACAGTECQVFSFGPPAEANGLVMTGDSAGLLRAFDARTGAVLTTIDLGGAISSGPAIVNGHVFIGAGTGGFGTNQKQGVYSLALAP